MADISVHEIHKYFGAKADYRIKRNTVPYKTNKIWKYSIKNNEGDFY